MLKSSINHYENQKGPVPPQLVRQSRCPIKQKRYSIIWNNRNFVRQIQVDIPCLYKVHQDQKIYYNLMFAILNKTKLDSYLILRNIIPYLFHNKDPEYEDAFNPYICRILEKVKSKLKTKSSFEKSKLVIRYTKYLSAEEKEIILKSDWINMDKCIENIIQENVCENEEYIYLSLYL